MGRLPDRTFPAILAGAAMLAAASLALAQSSAVDVGNVTEDGAEVRAGAGSSYYLVGRLKQGTVVNIDDRFFEWYKITPPPTIYSYIKKEYVTPGAEKGAGTINRDRAPVFAAAVSGPGESYRRQVDLHKGDAVAIEAEEGDYYRIRPPRHAYVYIRVASVKRVEFIPADVAAPATPAAAESAAPAADTTTAAAPMAEKAKAAAEGAAAATGEAAKAVVDTTVKAADATVKVAGDAVDSATATKAGTATREAAQVVVDKSVDATVAAAEKTGETIEQAAAPKAADATAKTPEATVEPMAAAAAESVESVNMAIAEPAAAEPAVADPTVAERTRTAATEAAEAASRAVDATVRGAGALVTKTGEAVTSAARATKEMIDPTPEPIVTPPKAAAPGALVTEATGAVTSDPPPRVTYTPTGDIRIPPLTEGRMVTASSEGAVSRGPAPTPVTIAPSVAAEALAPTPVAASPTPAPAAAEKATAEPEPVPAAETTVDLAGLEAQLAAAEKLPLEQQPLNELLAGYEALYSRPGMMPEDRRVVLQRIIKLRRNIALAATLREIGQMQQSLSSASTAEATPVAAGPRAPEYDAVGQLLASGVYDGVNMPRLYRIVSPRMRTIAYVRPGPGLDAVAMLGNIVGVEGQTRYDQSLRLDVLEPSSIVVLSPEAASTP